MKKIFMSAIMCASVAFAFGQAESYTAYQVNGTLGFASPGGSGSKGGIVINFEPQYHYSDNLSFGLRVSNALTLKASLDASGQAVGSFSAAGISSYQATGSYYFQSKPGAKFRPWAGVGLGFGRSVGVSGSSSSTTYADDYKTKSGFAASARVGFDVSHFRLNLDYNLNPKTGRIINNFIGINLGFYFGGGPKSDKK